MTEHSAVYFNRTRNILANEHDPYVLMQVFQKGENTVLCGMREVQRMLDERLWDSESFYECLKDGDIVQPWEPVLKIFGYLSDFADLESVYLGILARGSRVATNTRRVVEAANGKPVLFFADRFDRFENQEADGYAATIGGASAVCTQAMAKGAMRAKQTAVNPVGTMPHALIAAFNGDVVKACAAFRKHYPDVPLHALVDFNNDCVGDSIRCVEEFGEDLVGVRLDTSENMIDKSIAFQMSREDNLPFLSSVGSYKPTGVNPELVHLVRAGLDQNGGKHVQITVSGGFNVEKIKAFEAAGVPVDNYAVGSSLLKGGIDFTADVVKPVSKMGRREIFTDRLN